MTRAGGVQLDLFGETEQRATASDELQRVQEDWERLRWLDCCTGELCPAGAVPRAVRDRNGDVVRDQAGNAVTEPDPARETYPQVRCGRCGEFTFEYGMTINHDRMFGGCSTAEPARQYLDGDAARAWLLARHDRLHQADCVCGCPWGWHDRPTWVSPRGSCREGAGCCDGYEPGPFPPAQPSRCGPAWDPEP